MTTTLLTNTRPMAQRLRSGEDHDIGRIACIGADTIEALCTALEEAQKDAARIEFQQNNLAYEFTAEDDDGDLIWIAYRITGSRNDREWNRVAEGRTLREAIDAAIAAQGEKP